MDSSLENAMRHISAELKVNPGSNKMKLIEEACQKYDLDPMQQEFLTNKILFDK